jgi:hypothetical protein
MRDANGRFVPKQSDDNQPNPLHRVLTAWHARRFDIQLATRWKNNEALFNDATDAQRADFHAKLEEHANQLCLAMADGASESTLLAMAGQFYAQCTTMPRTAPPPPTADSEISRVGPGMMSLDYYRIPYRSIEVEVLKQLLKPGERIERVTIKEIVTSERTIARRDLMRATVPAYQTRFGSWDAQFPDPQSYEEEPVRWTPPTVVRD